MNYEYQKFCQSCGMPMGDTDDLYGHEANGTRNRNYCKYCYQNGMFTFNGTMAEMIEICIPPMVKSNPHMSEEQARQMMVKFMPTLKRWKGK